MYGAALCLQDLKRVLKKAVMDGRDLVFLFNDTQIMHEGFLEDINNILNAGECQQHSSHRRERLSAASRCVKSTRQAACRTNHRG